MGRNVYTSETTAMLPAVFIWGAVIVLLCIGGLMLKPMIMEYNRETVQQSQQYTEAKASFLTGQVSEYMKLAVEIAESTSEEVKTAKMNQQLAILARVHEEIDRLPESEVPISVRAFMSAHPKN